MQKSTLVFAMFTLTVGAFPLHAQTLKDPTAPTAAEPPSTVHRTVECGTTIFSGSRTTDPKIQKKTPDGWFTMRTVKPTICAGARGGPLNTGPIHLPTILGPKR